MKVKGCKRKDRKSTVIEEKNNSKKNKQEGRFYGVGVGPGDPKLVTLKAVEVIKHCKVIAIAVSSPALKEPIYEKAGKKSANSVYLEQCVAYQIALTAVPEIAQKAKLYLPMPMIKEKELLGHNHDMCAKKTEKILEKGKDVAFITLGDPTVYSTVIYVHKRLKRRGLNTSLVSGVPSFCAAAARLNMSLAENQQEIHIIPASYEIEKALEMSGTKILMKAGTKMPYVRMTLKEKGLQAQMVENCGLPDEQTYKQLDEIPDKSGYYSLIIIKEEK